MEHSMSSSMGRPFPILTGFFNWYGLRRGGFGMINRRNVGGFLRGHVFHRRCNAIDWGQEVGDVDEGKDEGREPEHMLMQKKGQEAKDRDKVHLNFS